MVNADGPNELLSNNLDGTFLPLVAEHDVPDSAVIHNLVAIHLLVPVVVTTPTPGSAFQHAADQPTDNRYHYANSNDE